MKVFDNEIDMLMKVAEKIDTLREYLGQELFNKENTELDYWYSYVAR